MKIYFYCNYSNSRRGFYLTKLCDNGLEAVSLSDSDNECEMLLDRFFSYDCFRVLWIDIPKDEMVLFNPEAKAAVFGIKGFTGEISDRKGYLNLAFLADENELLVFEKLAKGILSDINGFAKGVFDCLSVGGKNSYELDTERFMALIDKTEKEEALNLPAVIKSSCHTQRDMLKLGVFRDSWEYALRIIGSPWYWKIRPKQAIEENQFNELFGF